MLSGCSAGSKLASRRAQERIATAIPLDEARLSDISIPIGVTLQGVPLQEDVRGALVVSYMTGLSHQVVSDFYQQDMERLGWRRVARFVIEDELLMIYEKPHKVAVVSMRPSDKSFLVTIYTSSK